MNKKHVTVAVVTVGCPGRMQAKHHLVPPLILTEVLWEACDVAFGQPFEFPWQLLPLVHRIKAFHPEHDFHLYLVGKYTAKRLVLGIDQSFVFHVDEQAMNVRQ